MSLLKFLLGSKFQREKWKKRKEQQEEKIISSVDLSDPHQRRQLMNCIAYSPGIRDDGFLDSCRDDLSLTISESSTATDFENVITVVEVHNDTQDELDPEEVSLKSRNSIAADESASQLEAEDENDSQEQVDNNFSGEKVLTKEEKITEDCTEVKIESELIAEENILAENRNLETTSIGTDEEDLPDQRVPDLSGSSSESTGSTTLTPALSIEMETQTETPIFELKQESETQTEEIPEAVSLRPNHRYQMGHPHEMRLLSVALSELEADMLAAGNHKAAFRACSCSGNARPNGPSPNVGFSVEKNRQIARENANLLGRLQRTQSKIKRPNATAAFKPAESSYAINRRKQQEKIQRENLIILRKITDARGGPNSKKAAGSSAMLSSYS
ncbi:Hypothetical predicted protein [Cloeon dipterum]|uniref:Cilia- and flagella-associated protein 97 n=1 Tax=Cloeon dipterum TaxID=197152 RepID=A0A8S1C186_9INSE|nr:Hypothetical predicted protein [Cloeon dipterum]